MSTSLLGMDVQASRDLAARLALWPNSVDEVISLVREAELLADLPVGVTSLLDSIGGDGAVMAAAIRRAADALESFAIRLDSPLTIAAAVAAVKGFRGGDNDPELDERLRVLRTLVSAQTASDAETARVMALLLAANQAIDVRFRDTSAVVVARDAVERFNLLEATGAISSNDPRIDGAVRNLQTALADHATSAQQATDLLYAFVADRARQVATPTLLASVLTDQPVDVVRVAHANHVDYDVAEGLIKLDAIDRLTTLIGGASIASIDHLLAKRRDLLIDLAGGADVEVLASLSEQLGAGVAAIEAFAGLDDHLVERAERADQARVARLAEVLGIGNAEAEQRLAEMSAATTELAASGWPIDDAAAAVQRATMAGLDLAMIEATATDKQLSLVDAAELVAMADAYGLTLIEYEAYQGLLKHFDVFDSASNGDTDGVVSLWDLAHVVEHPNDYSTDTVAAAMSVLVASGLRNRIDSASETASVVGHKPFGANRPEDHKISLADIEAFEIKQQVNFLLRDHVDAIDVASQGGDLGQVDGALRKHDFEAFLASADASELDDSARAAIQLVIDADWHDQDWWERNGDSVILAAGFVAGAGVFLLTAGVGSGIIVASVLATAAGAGTGAVLTLGENALTGDPLGEDVFENTRVGAIGGLAAAGLMSGLGGQPARSLAVRVATRVGVGADVAGLVAAGGADPLLELVMDDIALRALHDDAAMVNYLAGGASVGLYAGAAIAANGSKELFAAVDEALVAEAVRNRNVAATQRLIGLNLDTARSSD